VLLWLHAVLMLSQLLGNQIDAVHLLLWYS
jgi:hypothetical protein